MPDGKRPGSFGSRTVALSEYDAPDPSGLKAAADADPRSSSPPPSVASLDSQTRSDQ